ncbi:hypothetical protein E4U42_001494 [Claviceps africana]|uniref:Uncharacterized protein n=1 Tax=Claviceps africana TaxID=83212 RepID=A0A8K0NMU1_9HYPO|nr:hypothetical protein E4U42_001494 [Claviceps africana]
MGKPATRGGRQGWLWPDARSDGLGFKSALAAVVWPCGIYARTGRRLRAARSGEDAENIPGPHMFSRDCALFAVCLPGSSCLVGLLQTEVRTFYGIDGGPCLDFCDGLLCTCYSLIRMEQEILSREEQRKRLVGTHSTQYQHHDPMRYSSPEYAMTKPSSKETSSSLEKTPAHSLVKHSLDDHGVVRTGTMRSPHGLEADATMAPSVKTTVSDHYVCRDPVTDLASAAASHGLSADKTTHFTNLQYDHNLSRDVLAGSDTGRVMGHGLPAHKPSQVPISRPAHQLKDDGPVLSEGRSGTGHVLDDDAREMPQARGRVKGPST